MPLNHAVLAPNRADAVIAAHPEIKQWAIGGHSLGGVMAASYVYGHPDCLQRLILWASYPTANNNLAIRSDLVATSIYATNDGLIPRSDIDDSKALLPPRTRFVAISGGNHAQFGWYGEQSGDAPASISRQEQQEEIVAATVELLR
jgi:pimeloyl-ACP methyl ester carboxylesterase